MTDQLSLFVKIEEDADVEERRKEVGANVLLARKGRPGNRLVLVACRTMNATRFWPTFASLCLS